MLQGLFITRTTGASVAASITVQQTNRATSWHSFLLSFIKQKVLRSIRYSVALTLRLTLILTFLYFGFGLSTANANGEHYANYLLLEEPIQPIPQTQPQQMEIVALGEKLFFDRRLSKNVNLSCADCHKLDHGGADDKNLSIAADGQPTRFNTPSIFNVALNSDYYWDAKFNSLELEMEDSISNLGSNWNDIIHRLNSIPEYRNAFGRIFDSGITKQNLQLSLLSFENSLFTPNSKFDQYLKGDIDALNKYEATGYHLFKSYGCVSCHQGSNVGGNISIQLDQLPFARKRIASSINFKSIKNSAFKRIRVPSLRNVAKTAPYFHDGSVNNLRLAVKLEGRFNSNTEIPENEVTMLIDFLNSLTGHYKGRSL